MLRRLLGRPRSEPIAAGRWQRIVFDLPFLQHLDSAALERLKARSEAFLATKRFSAAAGFEIDDDVRTAIAIQACLLTLNLDGEDDYPDFRGIVVYPESFVAPREYVDDAGVVHEYHDELAGESMDDGPVVLSWSDADPSTGYSGYNVVIHEFAHKLDLLDGAVNGAPLLPPALRDRWVRTMTAAYDDFSARLEAAETAIPRHIDPDSPAADAWYETLPLDPYAAIDPGEFFAVTVEAFFTDPQGIQQSYPALYALFRDYFRQDPLAGTPAASQS